MKKYILIVIVLMIAIFIWRFVFHKKDKGEETVQKYEASWESLKQHETPKWFRDAKFGIYFHWGVYSVPAYDNEWYPRNMYRKGSDAFKHHKENYGHPNFGYKDFIPQFTAATFNADEWAELFKKAGARFTGPVAEHHDGFAMWDTKYSQWNSARMGPKRDVLGEMAKAVRARGMKLVTSFHHAFNWKYYEPSYDGNYDTSNPDCAGLYGDVHEAGAPETEEFLKDWEAKVREVIDKYRPDYIWFDFGWGEHSFEPYKKSLIAYYYNKGDEWNKEVVISYKDDHLPEGVGILDYERGRADKLRERTWITDTSIDRESWCYIKNPDYKPVNELVDVLVDIVSKNGNLLLNIAPRPDGTIPQEQQERLLGIGEWLQVNGEAIYNTRPWLVYGEGPTNMAKGGGFSEEREVQYSAQDIRFTQKGDVLYAICLDWPETQLIIESLSTSTGLFQGEIKTVKMLGVDKALQWSINTRGLIIESPQEKPCDHAYVFKIEK